jgi:hypothetical protein
MGNTGCYGRGFYFSADFNIGAAYAAGYHGRPTGSRAVLLCKVLVGKDDFIPPATPNPTYQQLRPHHRFTTIVMQPLCLCRKVDFITGEVS